MFVFFSSLCNGTERPSAIRPTQNSIVQVRVMNWSGTSMAQWNPVKSKPAIDIRTVKTRWITLLCNRSFETLENTRCLPRSTLNVNKHFQHYWVTLCCVHSNTFQKSGLCSLKTGYRPVHSLRVVIYYLCVSLTKYRMSHQSEFYNSFIKTRNNFQHRLLLIYLSLAITADWFLRHRLRCPAAMSHNPHKTRY